MDPHDLLALVGSANLARAAPTAAEATLDAAFGCSERLAVYGTLAPGESNHHHLAACRGGWQPAAVSGRRSHRTYPVFTFDPAAPPVAMQLFTSADLPQHWPHLDAFEGADYRRILVPVFDATPARQLLTVANLYAAVTPVEPA